jgi:hypothetical protein
MKQLVSQTMDFRDISYLRIFRISVKKIRVPLKADKNKDMKTNVHFLSYLSQNILEWEMFQTKVLENVKKHKVFSNFFRKSFLLSYNVEKYCRAGQATGDNMAHAQCMLDT